MEEGTPFGWFFALESLDSQGENPSEGISFGKAKLLSAASHEDERGLRLHSLGASSSHPVHPPSVHLFLDQFSSIASGATNNNVNVVTILLQSHQQSQPMGICHQFLAAVLVTFRPFNCAMFDGMPTESGCFSCRNC